MSRICDVTDGLELTRDLARMAAAVSGDTVRAILDEAAQPVLEQMKMNATANPKRISGALHGAISIKVPKSVSPRVTIGIHRRDAEASRVADYAYPVEFGHGGPHPAPAHPFVRPAFDARCDEAFATIRERLKRALE